MIYNKSCDHRNSNLEISNQYTYVYYIIIIKKWYFHFIVTKVYKEFEKKRFGIKFKLIFSSISTEVKS